MVFILAYFLPNVRLSMTCSFFRRISLESKFVEIYVYRKTEDTMNGLLRLLNVPCNLIVWPMPNGEQVITVLERN